MSRKWMKASQLKDLCSNRESKGKGAPCQPGYCSHSIWQSRCIAKAWKDNVFSRSLVTCSAAGAEIGIVWQITAEVQAYTVCQLYKLSDQDSNLS